MSTRGRLIPSEAASPGERLRATPGVQRVPTPNLELFIVRHFLEPGLCAQLIERIDRDRRPSTILDDQGNGEYFRTSETCDLDGGDPVVARVNAAICELLGLPEEYS